MPKKAKITKKHIAAYKEALRKYSSRENVTGIDVGFKYKEGKKKKTIAVRIHVKEKFSPSGLEALNMLPFPEGIGGVPTDVIEAVYKAHSNRRNLLRRRHRFDPLQPGISVGHKDIDGGTLGAIVIDNYSEKPAILSNWHILAGSASAKPGDEIVQPSYYDGGRVEEDVVAHLERMILNYNGDAAIARLNDERQLDCQIYETNDFFTGMREPKIDEILIKSGRTTGITYGNVDGVGRYTIEYSVGEREIDGFKLVARKPGNPDDEEISSGGDSGSVWYDPTSYEAVGLNFAGETSSEPEEEHAIACYMTRVCQELNVRLPTESDIEHIHPPSTPESVIESMHAPSEADVMQMIATGLGSRFTEQLFQHIGDTSLQAIARNLIQRYPQLFGAQLTGEDRQAEAVAIGFAAGAAAKIIGKSLEQEGLFSPEKTVSMGMIATAFLLGVAAGNKMVDDNQE